MITLAISFFALAALMGIVLLTYVLTNKVTPKGIAILHGSFAALGVIFLLIAALNTPSIWIWVALFLIVVAVGFYMFARDMTGKKIPKVVAIIHGLFAVIIFISLVYYLFAY